MTALQFVLLLIAAVLFGLAAAGVGSPKFNLMAAGLCLMAVAFLLPLGAALF
jgi:hypothetical protein